MATPAPNLTNPSTHATYGDLFLRLLDSVLLLDPATYCILEVNPACERMFGMLPEKIVGRTLSQWVDVAYRSDLEKALRVAMRRYHPRQFDIQWKSSDGRTLVMDVLACPLTLKNGSTVLQVILRDITFRRETELRMQALLRDLKTANEKLEQLSTVDEMTGLYNYRYLKSELKMTHARCERESRPYSVLFCDIDYFKNFNDRNGHPTGDQLLREFAGLLQKSCRIVDIVARYGGEEFMVVCPATDMPGAMILAERLRASIENRKFRGGESQPAGKVTMSVGVATFPHHGSDPDTLLQAADEALYVSKTQGRNRVTSAKDLPRFVTQPAA